MQKYGMQLGALQNKTNFGHKMEVPNEMSTQMHSMWQGFCR